MSLEREYKICVKHVNLNEMVIKSDEIIMIIVFVKVWWVTWQRGEAHSIIVEVVCDGKGRCIKNLNVALTTSLEPSSPSTCSGTVPFQRLCVVLGSESSPTTRFPSFHHSIKFFLKIIWLFFYINWVIKLY